MTANLKALFDWISGDVLMPMYQFLQNFLLTPNFVSIALVVTAIVAMWKGWRAGAWTAGTFVVAWLTHEWITGSAGLGLSPWIVAVVFVAIAAGIFVARGRRMGITALVALLAAFALDQWFMVPQADDIGIAIPGLHDHLEWTMIALLTFVAYATKGWKLALGSLIGFAVIYGVGQWPNSMASFALVLVASIIAVGIGIPVGILAAKNKVVAAIVRPILDFLQTMPAFVYLIPFVMLFRIGVVPGIVATILFSIAPAVRFTELGIKQVDKEVVEAAHAFGAHPARILGQIELPLARQTIMGGVNQVIMLALSMVVIAGMVGAAGLGRDVYTSVTQVNMVLGAESGLAVVILAMYLDRTTAAFGLSKREQAAA